MAGKIVLKKKKKTVLLNELIFRGLVVVMNMIMTIFGYAFVLA